MCLDNARENGVEVRTDIKVESVIFENGHAVGVRAKAGDGEPYELRAKVVVDASGRRTVIGSKLGLKEDVPGLKKASLWSYYRGGKRLEGIDAGGNNCFHDPGTRVVLVHPASR